MNQRAGRQLNMTNFIKAKPENWARLIERKTNRKNTELLHLFLETFNKYELSYLNVLSRGVHRINTFSEFKLCLLIISDTMLGLKL